MRFKDKTIVVTGSGRGIGAEIAKGFAREGGRMVLVSRTAEQLADQARYIRDTYGVPVLEVKADVADLEKVERMTQRVIEEFGTIDVLINCAGMAMVAPSFELTEEQWHTCLKVNLDSAFFCSQRIGRQMMESGRGGKIVNITSIAAHAGLPERAAYGASKGGVMQLTQTLAVEWGKHNIQVNAITPGFIWTESLQTLIDRGVHKPERMTVRIPAGRLGRAQDIVGPALFLSSADADYVTGTVLKVDGGWLANGYV